MKETVEYDELTINERQKGDETFFTMLDSVRHGCLTDELLIRLKVVYLMFHNKKNYKELKSEGNNHYFLRQKPVKTSMN